MKGQVMKAAILTTAALAWTACSSNSSAGPTPTLAGTWHINIQTLDSGSVSPSSFDVSVKASGSSYTVSMPILSWSGKLTFNAPTFITFSTDTLAGFGSEVFGLNAFGACGTVEFYGRPDANKDSLEHASIAIFDSLADLGGGSFACAKRWTGSISARKTGSASSPTPPAPNPAGAWQVTMGAGTVGSLTPNPLTATITAAAGTLAVALPTLTFNVGPVTFDTLPFALVSHDTLQFGVLRHGVTGPCQAVVFAGLTRGDTTDGTAFVLDSNYANNASLCAVQSMAPFHALK